MIGDASCRVLMQLLAYAYPAYLTYKDIERGADDQLARWSKYWLVIAGLTALQPGALVARGGLYARLAAMQFDLEPAA